MGILFKRRRQPKNFVDNPSWESIEKRSKAVAPVGSLASGVTVRNGLFDPYIDPRAYITAVDSIAELAVAIDKIVIESTKNGYGIEPKFAYKCMECGKEYEEGKPSKCNGTKTKEDGEVIECDSTRFRGPDRSQIVEIESLLEKPNVDKHGDVVKPFKDILRDAIYYLTVLDEWDWEITFNQIGEPGEIYSLPAEFIRKSGDLNFAVEKEKWKYQGGSEDSEIYHCPKCNDLRVYKDPGQCGECQQPLEMVAYAQIDDNDKLVALWSKRYILNGNSRAWGTRIYGIPRMQAVWVAAQTLNWMLRYQWAAYSNNKNPDSIVTFPEMQQQQVNDMVEQAATFKRENPEFRRDVWLGATKAPERLKLLDSLVDLNAIEMARYIREVISIRFGVSLNMLGIQTPGKLGKETETVEVSYDTIEEAQNQVSDFINSKLLTLYKDEYGRPLITDWEFKIYSPKKDDELRLAEVRGHNARIVTELRASGVTAELDEAWEPVIKDWGELPEPSQPSHGFGDGWDFNLSAGIEKGLKSDVQNLIMSYIKRARAHPETADKIVGEMKSDFLREIKSDTETALMDEYLQGKRSVMRGANFTALDMKRINAILKEETLWEAYSGMADETSEKINEILREAIAQPRVSISDMVKDMNEVWSGARSRLRTIAVNETLNAMKAGRVAGYMDSDPEGVNKYDWSIHVDARTSDVCKAIKKRVDAEGKGYGVTLKRLNEIIKEESKKHGYDPRDYHPHIHCRSTIKRNFRGVK